ncbi:hypothetical protein PC9H_003095 [Pleurotus ostreatus]|uniref:Diphthamide biosynthesis protein 4 n=2 Tax=Pleurotus ostreatus TaxID=5322 RepID=A0A8H7DXN9_PLEOS|nr:uncharacterized protein PC9H_003095 [Pleurotus ostreatus]KAF7436266.1 hypothetical protein PC9H_003095 [Pleurotus ostreatus]
MWTIRGQTNIMKLPCVKSKRPSVSKSNNLAGSLKDVDYYQLLDVPRHASEVEIKAAYHRVLLRLHPDKNRTGERFDIALIKEAYEVLSAAHRREAYDAAILKEKLSKLSSTAPRPAQVISLEDFNETPNGETDEVASWWYGCRCGGNYVIPTQAMERGEHLIGCSSCSEVIWAGYEIAEEEDGA